jgi:hypothetical protein
MVRLTQSITDHNESSRLCWSSSSLVRRYANDFR